LSLILNCIFPNSDFESQKRVFLSISELFRKMAQAIRSDAFSLFLLCISLGRHAAHKTPHHCDLCRPYFLGRARRRAHRPDIWGSDLRNCFYFSNSKGIFRIAVLPPLRQNEESIRKTLPQIFGRRARRGAQPKKMVNTLRIDGAFCVPHGGDQARKTKKTRLIKLPVPFIEKLGNRSKNAFFGCEKIIRGTLTLTRLLSRVAFCRVCR